MSWEVRNCDSLRELRVLDQESIDAVVTDPPYSSGGMTRGDRMAQPSVKYQNSESAAEYPEFFGDSRDQRGFLAWTSLWMAEAWRATRTGGVIAVFSDWRMLPTMTDAVQAGGWVWRGILPWCKPSHRPQKGRFGAGAEFIVWGSRGAMPFERGVPVLPGFLEFDHEEPPAFMVENQPRERLHMTEKPIAVLRALCRLCTPGGVVLDPFAGSASTGVAALMEGRSFIGFEMSPEYHRIAVERMSAHERGNTVKAERAGQGSLFGGSP